MESWKKSKFDDCLVDPEFFEIHEAKEGCGKLFKGKCDNPTCARKYEGFGTCLWCQKGKIRPIS